MENQTKNVEVEVDLGVYSQNAIFKATYKFTDHWYVEVTTAGTNAVRLNFIPKDPTAPTCNPKGDFLNELLDQRLREQIGSETLAVRNLILAHALSKLDLVQPPGEHDNIQRE